jgi:acyl-CoA thioesterase I
MNLDEALLERYARGIGIDSGPFLDALWTPPDHQDPTVAAMLGITAERLAELRAGFRDRVEGSADALLAEPEFAEQVRALPFASSDRVLVVGDSITADAVGWANILRVLLQRTRPGIQVSNRAVSGRTTAETLYNLAFAAPVEPTRALVMLGTNDTRRLGSLVGARMASLGETERNLGLIRRLLTEQLGARVVTLLTPPPVDPAPVAARREAGEWNLPEDVEGVRDLILRLDPAAVDVCGTVRTDASFFDVDGLHPTPAGQVAIVRTVVGLLGAAAQGRARSRTADTP